MSTLTEYERKILRVLNGDQIPGLQWGAAMGEAIEFLEEEGLVKQEGDKYIITKKGVEALNAPE